MNYHHLTEFKRCQLYSYKSTGMTQKAIADRIGVSPSTVSREIRRNSGKKGYRYKQAHKLATHRRAAASVAPTVMTEQMKLLLNQKIKCRWSPEQISGVLKANKIYISHETIYRYIWSDKASGGYLYKYLRRQGKRYNYSRGKAGRGLIPNRVDISQRPKIVDTKSRIGDWEADLIIGAKHQGGILSLVDRKSKYTLLQPVKSKAAPEVTDKIISSLLAKKNIKVKTITFDNGKEFSGHKIISEKLGTKCFFATPYSSWERGLNEHTNGLVRQYFPKGMNMLLLSKREIKFVENDLNSRPRKVLNYRTPKEVLLGISKPMKIALRC